MRVVFLILSLLSFEFFAQDLAQLRLYSLGKEKTGLYRGEGIFYQRETPQNKTELLQVRRAYNQELKCERLVFDFSAKTPWFIYSVYTEKAHRLSFDFKGVVLNKKLELPGTGILSQLKVYKLDKEKISIDFSVKNKSKIEMFVLGNPARLVVDLQ